MPTFKNFTKKSLIFIISTQIFLKIRGVQPPLPKFRGGRLRPPQPPLLWRPCTVLCVTCIHTVLCVTCVLMTREGTMFKIESCRVYIYKITNLRPVLHFEGYRLRTKIYFRYFVTHSLYKLQHQNKCFFLLIVRILTTYFR